MIGLLLKQRKIMWLRETFPWMGKHSGYDRLFDYLERKNDEQICTSVWRIVDEPIPLGLKKIVRKLTRIVTPNIFYNDQSLFAELKLILICLVKRIDLVHIAYIEDCCSIIPVFKRLLGIKLVGTIHQPCSWWESKHRRKEMLSRFDALIVLSSKEEKYFDQYLPGRVFFIPHGIDLEYFKPIVKTKSNGSKEDHCIFCGKWMRDIDTLNEIIKKVTSLENTIHFDIVGDTSLSMLIHQNEKVHFYYDISDTQLLKLYQDASLMVLPMIECTANNALLEALACGLPVVTNDVGGIEDYTTDAFVYKRPVGDIDGMISKILQITKNDERKREMSSASRKFVEEKLSWFSVAKKVQQLYDIIY